jgi:AraC-like DNA-binding protein
LFISKIKDMNISFVEYKPDISLQPYIESYWRARFNIDRRILFSQNVIPNGCIELIIHLSEDHCALNRNDEPYRKSPPYTLIGIYNNPYIVRFSEQVEVFGIRFFPDGFRNIFGIPPGEFLSTYEDGGCVVGNTFDEFCARLRETVGTGEKINLANGYLLNQLQQNMKKYDITHLAMQYIRLKDGMIDFRELAEKVPISLRQLQREFKNHYRMKITDYLRLIRLNAINRYMLSQNLSMTELAYELDFTDQSHFIREFKQYTGVTPKKFIRDKDNFIVNAV